ncbi:MAG: PilZ domain-containing protein [Pseudorhodoplanes sp.]|uniref:PilZ domain-containing protein n=1 Tax=Pseudorhodoplanes sp. TaxID=1934341 RepID=UPI003D1171FF
MAEPAGNPQDIEIVDRRRSARTSVSVAGRYSLAGRRNARGERREFACRTVDISADYVALIGPVTGPVGERVIAQFEELGKLDGRIIRVFETGFVIRLVLPDSGRAWLAAKIDWLDKHEFHNLPDDRTHKRIVPEKPHSTLLLADGTTSGCFVIDMSVAGAAVSTEITPQLGDVLAVGSVIGRVVRLFPEGFALRFMQLQDPGLLEHRLIRP